MGTTDSSNMVRQSRHRLHDVLFEIQEITRLSEELMEINSLMMGMAAQANCLSAKATEEVSARGADKGMALVAYEAYKLVKFSREQSESTRRMLTEIKESIDKINYPLNKVLNRFRAMSVPQFKV